MKAVIISVLLVFLVSCRMNESTENIDIQYTDEIRNVIIKPSKKVPAQNKEEYLITEKEEISTIINKLNSCEPISRYGDKTISYSVLIEVNYTDRKKCFLWL